MVLWSCEQIAEIFGVKKSTVQFWKYRDEAFPKTRIISGRSWGVSTEALEAWITVKQADAGDRADEVLAIKDWKHRG